MAVIEIKDEALKGRFTAFVAALGKSEEEIATALKGELGETITDAAVNNLGDPDITPDNDLLTALTGAGVAKATARAAIKGIRNAPAPAPETERPTVDASALVPALSMLPSVPKGVGLLSALKVGGVVRFKPETLVGAVSVLLADALGLADIEETLRGKIEDRCERTGRQVPDVYLKIDSIAKSKEYGDMLAVIRDELGITDRRRYVSNAEREKLFASLTPIFTELKGVQDVLQAYVDKMITGGGNSAAFTQALLGMAAGMPVNPALAAMMKPPPPTAVIAAIEGFIERTNKKFAATRAITAAALLPEQAAITAILDNQELYTALGVQDREEMLQELGFGANSDLVLAEQNVAVFLLGVFEIPKKDSASLPMYIGSLASLGADIEWDRLDAVVRNRKLPRTPVAPRGRGNERGDPPPRAY